MLFLGKARFPRGRRSAEETPAETEILLNKESFHSRHLQESLHYLVPQPYHRPNNPVAPLSAPGTPSLTQSPPGSLDEQQVVVRCHSTKAALVCPTRVAPPLAEYCSVNAIILFFLSSSSSSSSHAMSGHPPDQTRLRDHVETSGAVLFTCTFYHNTSDLRFLQCLETIREAEKYNLPLVIVDGSPDPIHEVLCATTTTSGRSLLVVEKEVKGSGGKGAQLRAAAKIASSLPGVTDATLLCWQEAEKTDMVRLWREVQERLEHTDDVVVPYRNPEEFQGSYPIEQFHSETYGNFYLDCVMNDALQVDQTAKPPRLSDIALRQAFDDSRHRIPSIDWHFGPFAFRARHCNLWLRYRRGDSYDAQLVPIVHAMRKGLLVSSVLVKFSLDPRMKSQEEENIQFIEKRLNQLTDLDPKVKKAWTDGFYC
jgi:hypothetical protein